MGTGRADYSRWATAFAGARRAAPRGGGPAPAHTGSVRGPDGGLPAPAQDRGAACVAAGGVGARATRSSGSTRWHGSRVGPGSGRSAGRCGGVSFGCVSRAWADGPFRLNGGRGTLARCDRWVAGSGWCGSRARADHCNRHLQPACGRVAGNTLGRGSAMSARVAHLWWTLFPALLALQSLAGLGLAWWIWARSGPPGDRHVPLGRLREFRFADELVWLPIVAIVIVVLPLGGALTRAAGNVLFFMGGFVRPAGSGCVRSSSGGHAAVRARRRGDTRPVTVSFRACRRTGHGCR